MRSDANFYCPVWRVARHGAAFTESCGGHALTCCTFSGVLRSYWKHWAVCFVLVLSHTAIMYGVDVPDAFGEQCGRGKLTPVCNAATYIDKAIFGVNHMHVHPRALSPVNSPLPRARQQHHCSLLVLDRIKRAAQKLRKRLGMQRDAVSGACRYFPANGGDSSGNDMTYQRLPECSGCSPGKCAMPAGVERPVWCYQVSCAEGCLLGPCALSAHQLVLISQGHTWLALSPFAGAV